MQKMLLTLAAFGQLAAPAMAQTAAQAAGPEAAPAAEQKVVKKVVCQKIEEDRTTGSRLGSTSKVCRTVKVAVDSAAEKAAEAGTSNSR